MIRTGIRRDRSAAARHSRWASASQARPGTSAGPAPHPEPPRRFACPAETISTAPAATPPKRGRLERDEGWAALARPWRAGNGAAVFRRHRSPAPRPDPLEPSSQSQGLARLARTCLGDGDGGGPIVWLVTRLPGAEWPVHPRQRYALGRTLPVRPSMAPGPARCRSSVAPALSRSVSRQGAGPNGALAERACGASGLVSLRKAQCSAPSSQCKFEFPGWVAFCLSACGPGCVKSGHSAQGSG